MINKKVSSIVIFSLLLLTQYQFALTKPVDTVQEEVKFKSGNIMLSGTLILPVGDGPFPLIIFVHGSGPETRDNSQYSANWLASIGYAAFIYDKRGAGKSEGKKEEIRNFSFEDLANDVIAAIDILSKKNIIDNSKIGIHASSQGGWVAPLAAVESKLISFMIIRSASVVTVSEDRIFERGERLRGEGFIETEISESREMQLLEGKSKCDINYEKFDQLFVKNREKKWFESVYGVETKLDELDKYREWYGTVAEFNPISYLEKINIPIMWLFGDPAKDELGPIEKSVENVELLKKEGKEYLILQLEGEGHNINEATYERALFDWLRKINHYDLYEFKKHEDMFK